MKSLVSAYKKKTKQKTKKKNMDAVKYTDVRQTLNSKGPADPTGQMDLQALGYSPAP